MKRIPILLLIPILILSAASCSNPQTEEQEWYSLDEYNETFGNGNETPQP